MNKISANIVVVKYLLFYQTDIEAPIKSQDKKDNGERKIRSKYDGKTGRGFTPSHARQAF